MTKGLSEWEGSVCDGDDDAASGDKKCRDLKEQALKLYVLLTRCVKDCSNT